jgi:2-alkyl-3-oxoalkanoate reductase
MHYVYVGDLVKAARLAEKSKISSGDYIIAGDKPTSLKEVVKHISKSVNVEMPKFTIPRSLVLLASYPIGILKKMGFDVPIYPFRVKTMTSTYFYDISKARRELGYKPTVTFSKGTKMTENGT